MIQLLSIVAAVLIGHSTPVHCSPFPGHPWKGAVYGYASWPPDQIWLRACRATVALDRWADDIFAHEMLHIEHKNWPHWKVYATQHSYGALVKATIKEYK